jgi:uncharacterized membrane protein
LRRLSATLLLVGLVLTIVAQAPHPVGTSLANVDAFTAYAASSVEFYNAIHLAQFTGEALLMVGLLVLFFALDLSAGMARMVGILGAVSAGAGLALTGVVMAVDAVALKQAVDAWASAPAAEKAARFASAEAIRWLEWGTSAYANFVMGLALVLLGIVVAWTGRVPRPIGLFMGASGLAIILAGWLTAIAGFGGATSLAVLAGFGCLLAFAMWLLIVSWTTKVGDWPEDRPPLVLPKEPTSLLPAGVRRD